MADLVRRASGLQGTPRVAVDGAFHLATDGNGQFHKRSLFAVDRPCLGARCPKRVVSRE